MAFAGGGQEGSEGLWGREGGKVLESKEKEEWDKGVAEVFRLKGGREQGGR